MKVLTVLLIIVAAFWLIGHIPLGGWVQYDEDGVLIKAIAGPLKILLFPKKELSEDEKAKKAAKEKVKKAKSEAKKAKQEAKKAEKKAKWRAKHPGQEPEEPQKKKGGALPPVLKLLPLVGEAAGGLKRRICINELTLHVTWAAEDAASAAIGYGRGNAVMGMIWPLIDNNFDVKKSDLDVSIDFFATSPTVMCRAALTIRLGQILSLGLRLVFKFLTIMIKSRAETTERNSSTKKQEA